jgi:hypothetical protein
MTMNDFGFLHDSRFVGISLGDNSEMEITFIGRSAEKTTVIFEKVIDCCINNFSTSNVVLNIDVYSALKLHQAEVAKLNYLSREDFLSCVNGHYPDSRIFSLSSSDSAEALIWFSGILTKETFKSSDQAK